MVLSLNIFIVIVETIQDKIQLICLRKFGGLINP